jgi:hypothetical protein
VSGGIKDNCRRQHRNVRSTPEAFLEVVAPYRDDLVVAAECVFTWYWLADVSAQGGHRDRAGARAGDETIHGGKAKNDKLDSFKIATLLRGGLLPQASVYSVTMRSTRDLLRRRLHLMRKPGQPLAHIQSTRAQYNVPEFKRRIAWERVFFDHYNGWRPHRSLDLAPPNGRTPAATWTETQAIKAKTSGQSRRTPA